MSKIERLSGFWAGHILLWGAVCPEMPQAVFTPEADYNLRQVQSAGVADVGEIYQIKKDHTGLFILVKTDRIPENYEWSYTVGTPQVIYKMSAEDGSTSPILVAYPLATIQYKNTEIPDALHSTPAGVVRRTKRPASAVHDEPVSGENPRTPD